MLRKHLFVDLLLFFEILLAEGREFFELLLRSHIAGLDFKNEFGLRFCGCVFPSELKSAGLCK